MLQGLCEWLKLPLITLLTLLTLTLLTLALITLTLSISLKDDLLDECEKNPGSQNPSYTDTLVNMVPCALRALGTKMASLTV